MSPSARRASSLAPLLALFAAGENGDAQAGAGGERRDGLEMLPRQDFGRRHQRGLLADLGDGGGREQRDHGLARSDVALQQAQHAQRLRRSPAIAAAASRCEDVSA